MGEETTTPPTIMWFRRDLRILDNPALVAAAAAGDGRVAGVFLIDQTLVAESGPARITFLANALASLDTSMGQRLVIRTGDPIVELKQLVLELGAKQVFVTEEFTPYSMNRDERAALALGEVGATLVRVDSPYLVAPGVIKNLSGEPYKVFGGFRRVWEANTSSLEPTPAPEVEWIEVAGPKESISFSPAKRPTYFGDTKEAEPSEIPDASEAAAQRIVAEFAKRSSNYADDRDVPSLEGTSKLSPYLRFGIIHPRQILAQVSRDDAGGRTFASEIAWRDFYADVMFNNPSSRYEALQEKMSRLRSDSDETAVARFRAWTRGETGYPLVDAGMRQLLQEGWMHNRVRMVTASFLIKHLHIDWRWGAKWFMVNLLDGDIASNQHGWQWVAGTGTDAAPFHRVFNPTLQAERFDPTGAYIKRYIPELREVAAPECLRPLGGTLLGGLDYPPPIVDHIAERNEALARLAELKPELR